MKLIGTHSIRPVQPPVRRRATKSPRVAIAGIEQVDDGGRLFEVCRTPGDRLGASFDVADRNREARPPETHVPAAEQTPAHQARQRRLVPVHERSGPDDPNRNPEGRGFALRQLLLQTLAPGVRTKASRISRAWRVLVLALPRGPRWSDHREAAHKDEPLDIGGVHRMKKVTRRIDRVALMLGVAP